MCVWSGGRSEAAAGEVAVQRSVEGLSVVQELVKQGRPARLCWVTSGAVSLGGERSVTPETAALWGLGRTVMQEHPELGCKLVDVEGGKGQRSPCFGSWASGTTKSRWRGEGVVVTWRDW